MDPPVERTPPRPPSPGLPASAAVPTSAPATPASTTLKLDLSLASAVSALVHHLVAPLALHYSHSQLMGLRSYLTAALSKAYAPTWKESNQHFGSGTRSLIADHIHGLPPVLQQAAKANGIDVATWSSAIAGIRKRKADSSDSDLWEVWCDPGMVVWRWGGWGWDEVDFDPVKSRRESYHVIWQATPNIASPAAEMTSPAAVTPLRSKAIPIRAPTLMNIPPTPSPVPSAASVSSAPIVPHSPSPVYPTEAYAPRTTAADVRPPHSRHASTRSGPGHKGQGSTSSTASDSSDTGSQQLLTPASRPGSADLFPEDKEERGRDPSPARNEPTVTPYDGGNVTVLGGGTKLGGSRPSSVMSHRTRSPSISVASRALNPAVGSNANGGNMRKQRSRAPRRIQPTLLSQFSQPGIGGPMINAFTPPLKHQPGMQFWPHGQPGAPGVGVGVAPPPVGGMGLANQMGMAHAMDKRL
ncbi:hypothetical protein CC85DRAFT_310040 [Cutaneotrichosporon oleaginosum]|uniref:Anti-proliferative protein domain-containing protein n=1 Tax=Cutaneotrichosporon oleaginosum TaxID=879819 RepID=A0A0J0XZL1_9TREE|nr:uncharacterized protein CC85DRAFT_310040 [Cutaneotrichosporon oleaginosum]KLT46472.1 hypothetical protein CC85DRAFT_310040 [Cutaneotrichosporon oleaginosum]TXT15160.1 hypothetical protein COLE_01353 [Cutaneotrichosporon oleaginosum]